MEKPNLRKLSTEERVAYYRSLIGQRSGKLRVINGCKQGIWVKCACGKEKLVRGYDFVKGRHKSCGCEHVTGNRKKVEKTHVGKQYGDLKVLGVAGKDKKNKTLFLLQCACGKKIKLPSVKIKNLKSCGCRRYEFFKKNPSPAQRLSDDQVKEIFELCKLYDDKTIAEWYLLAENTVKKIRLGLMHQRILGGKKVIASNIPKRQSPK